MHWPVRRRFSADLFRSKRAEKKLARLKKVAELWSVENRLTTES